jgi:hypothetical protein
MQESPAYAIKVLELDFGQICSIRPGLLLQEEYAAALVAAFPIRLGWAMEGDGATGLSRLLTRDGTYSCACLSYDSLAPGALVKLLHHWLAHPDVVRDFPGYLSRAARNWEFEFNHENAMNNVRRALGFAHAHVNSTMVCSLLEHIFKHNRNTAQLHTIARMASQHPWPSRLHLPFKVVRTWLMDTVAGAGAVREAMRVMRVAEAAAEGKDIRMGPARSPHNASFELVPRSDQGQTRDCRGSAAAAPRSDQGQTRLVVPTRQALEEAVEGRAANSLLTTKSRTTEADRFLLHNRFLAEYLGTSPLAAATPGTYNVVRPYSDEFGYFVSDSMFESDGLRRLLPAPDASEGTRCGFGVYELVTGFHELLIDCKFFETQCEDVDLQAEGEGAPGPLFFVGAFEDSSRGVFVDAAHCSTADRAKLMFQQYLERCGLLLGGARVMRLKGSRWDVYEGLLKCMNMTPASHFQRRNQALALTRQLMRLITQEKHAAQMTRHVRMVAAEIQSLANKMEVQHTGRPMLGEPLFGGGPAVPYTPEGVATALRQGELALALARGSPPKPKRTYGKGGAKAAPTPSPEPSAEETVEAIFKGKQLSPEVTQALSDVLLTNRHLHESSRTAQSSSSKGEAQPTTRGTRILRLMLDSDHDWAPIMRRIAGFIYTPAFERIRLPLIERTQVARPTRAQRKVRLVASFIFLFRAGLRIGGAAPAQSHGTVAAQRRGC